jgi:ribbon-helix-helix protein, copG family
LKNLSNFKLNNDVTTGFAEADDQTAKLDKISELEAALAKYKRLGRPKSENPPTRQMTAYLSDDEMGFLTKEAKEKGISKNQVLRNLIAKQINR